MMKVGILISGRGSNMIAAIRGAKYYKVDLVLAHEEVEGLEKARAEGVETVVVEKDDAKIHDILKTYSIDFVVLAGYMRILGAKFVKDWQEKLMNIHPSLLPKYKGLHTHKRALKAREEEHGCSVHWVSEELDAGVIIEQKKLKIKAGHTEESLAADVLKLEHELLPATINQIAYQIEEGKKAMQQGVYRYVG